MDLDLKCLKFGYSRSVTRTLWQWSGFWERVPRDFVLVLAKPPLAEVSHTWSRQEWGKLLLVYSLRFFLLELSNKKIVLRFGSFVCFLVYFYFKIRSNEVLLWDAAVFATNPSCDPVVWEHCSSHRAGTEVWAVHPEQHPSENPLQSAQEQGLQFCFPCMQMGAEQDINKS